MKKFLFGSALALSLMISNGAFAQSRDLTGLYAGVYGGYGWTDVDNSNGGDPEPSGIDYGIYGGYKIDSILQDAGLGITGALELHWGGSTADDTVNGVKLEKGRELGISFRPGLTFLNNETYSINPYGILGYRLTEYEAQVIGLSADEDYHGLSLGVGTELMTQENMGVRLDYTYTWYAEENGIDPSESNLRLGIGFDF